MTIRDHRAFRITVRSDGFKPADQIAGRLKAVQDRPGPPRRHRGGDSLAPLTFGAE